MLRDLLFQAYPIPASAPWLFTPHVKLQLPLACWRPVECLIRSIASGKFTGGFTGCKVDCFENIFIQLFCSVTFEGMSQQKNCIRKSLYAKANGTMLHVGEACLRNWVVVAVDNFVEVKSGDL